MVQERDKQPHFFQSLDWFTILLWLLLIVAGWVSIYAATYSFGEAPTLDMASRAGKQIIWIGLAITIGGVILLVDDRIYDTVAYILYFLMLGLLAITPFIATEHKGSLSWISFGSISLQPAEFAKTITALALARLMGSYGFSLSRPRHFILAASMVFLPILLIIMQKETGSALVFFVFFLMFYREGMSGSILFVAIAFVIYFVIGLRYEPFQLEHTLCSEGNFIVLLLIQLFTSGLLLIYEKNKRLGGHLFLATLMVTLIAWGISRFIMPYNIVWVQWALIAATAIWLIILALRHHTYRFLLYLAFLLGSAAMHSATNFVMNNVLQEHQQKRILVSLGIVDDPRGVGYNVHQSEIAIGSGGITGKGFLNGTQTKLSYVPEQATDFIFCTVGEEMGFMGAAVVLLLFLTLILRLIHLAERQRYASYRIYGYCVLSIFLFHLFINIGMVMGLTPVIGIPLPFFSYGGSSLWGFTILLFIFLRMDASRERK